MNFEEVIKKQSKEIYSFLLAGDTKESSEVSIDYSRCLFNVYLVFLRAGLLTKTTPTVSTAIKCVPNEYKYVARELRDSFHVTAATVTNICKEYSYALDFQLSSELQSSLSSLLLLLPKTAGQCNEFLLSEKVIERELSPEGLEFLLGKVTKHEVKSCPIPVYDNSRQVEIKARRNTSRSVDVLCVGHQVKTIKPFFRKIIKNVDRSAHTFGFSYLPMIVDSFQILDVNKKKNNTSLAMLTSFFSVRDEFIQCNDTIIIPKNIDSSYIAQCLTRMVLNYDSLTLGQVVKILCTHVSYFQNYHDGSSAKTSKLSDSDYVKGYPVQDFINEDLARSLCNSVDSLVVDNNGIVNISNREKIAIHPNVLTNTWSRYVLDFRKSCLLKFGENYDVAKSEFYEYLKNVMIDLFDSTLESERYLSKVEGKYVLLEENVRFMESQQGVFNGYKVNKDCFDAINEKIYLLQRELDDYRSTCKFTGDVYLETLMSSYPAFKPKQDHHLLYSNPDFVTDFKSVVENSYYADVYSLLVSIRNILEVKLVEYTDRLAFVDAQIEHDIRMPHFPSDKALSSLRDKPEGIASALRIIDQLIAFCLDSQCAKKVKALKESIDNLFESRNDCIVDPVVNRLGKSMQLISNGSAVSREELLDGLHAWFDLPSTNKEGFQTWLMSMWVRFFIKPTHIYATAI